MSEAARDIAAEIVRAAREQRTVVVATVISSPDASLAPASKLLYRPDGTVLGSLGGGALETAILADCAFPLADARPAVRLLHYDAAGKRLVRSTDDAYAVMIEMFTTTPTLLIVGGGHISLALATMAHQVGFSIAVLDDRAA